MRSEWNALPNPNKLFSGTENGNISDNFVKPNNSENSKKTERSRYIAELNIKDSLGLNEITIGISRRNKNKIDMPLKVLPCTR